MKLEIRNPKSEDEAAGRPTTGKFHFRISVFEFPSSFEFRISNFNL